MPASLPTTYKAAVFESKGTKLALRDVVLQQPGPGYILVKVLACGICHSDLFVQQGYLGDVFPRVPGHEAVGDVVAIGESVTNFKIGDRVGAAWHGGRHHLLTITIKVLIATNNLWQHRTRRIMPILPTRTVPNMQEWRNQWCDNGRWLRGVCPTTR